ncbi:hypothetical protein Golob_017406 [Gossypium lobatum]|uniref:Zinc knuckle CX2CX4HX4C domain-containing protein n=1 Tax=Gossypium lobatum TaxID=34289 RepID=A0A7J8M726_9ROSI|nr:hypothetical protein [Gossypium lobatum]
MEFSTSRGISSQRDDLGETGMAIAMKKVRQREDQDPPDGNTMAMEEDMIGQMTFKAMLLDGKSGKEGSETYEDDGFDLKDGNVITQLVDGVPDIRFSERVHTLIHKSISKLVVIKLLGHRIDFNALCTKLYSLWRSKRALIPTNGFRERLLHRFSDAMYKKNLLKAKGNIIGQVIKVDDNTENGSRGRFASMAISIDLKQPLVSKIWIEGRLQRVEYESLPNVCFECDLFGHLQDFCPKIGKSTRDIGDDVDDRGHVGTSHEQQPVTTDLDKRAKGEAFGSWMVIAKKFKRKSKKPLDEGLPQHPRNTGSRFNLIAKQND